MTTNEKKTVDYILEIALGPEDQHLQDAIDGILYMWGVAGTVVETRGDSSVVRAFFSDAASRETAAGRIAAVGDLPMERFDVERRDWLEHYEQSLKPILIGRTFVVAPDARLVVQHSDRTPIIVPQERAFGTGSHETTSLCIEVLEEAKVEGKRGVDIGTGSGILAIAMAKLGVKSVVAFDNDLEAYEALRANMTRNGVSSDVMFPFIGGVEALREATFEIATMNIIPEVITPLLPSVRLLLASGAMIAFSGILNTARDAFVAAATSHGFSLTRELAKGEWWCGVFNRS